MASIVISTGTARAETLGFDRPLPSLAPPAELTWQTAQQKIDEGPAPMSPHVNIGYEYSGTSDVSSGVMRTHLGASWAFGRGRVRPMIGGGATLGLGKLSVDDPRALDGSVDIRYFDYGPEAQLGVRFVTGGIVDTRMFVSFAYLRTELDERLMIDSVGGVGGARGMRATLGVNWADSLVGPVASSNKRDQSGWYMLLLPHQAELGWMRSAGSDRIGFTVSYGI
jgi:hypothetical protein